MARKYFLIISMILVSLLVSLGSANSLQATLEQLQYSITNRANEMDVNVFEDFKKQYKCKDCDLKTFQILLHEFEVYKRNWVNEMVNFIINELDIQEQKAQFVRANPEKYFADYQTFKLLRFQ